MSDDGDPDVTRLLRDLTAELRHLQREVETADRRGPSPGDLSRFTSEVAIPGLILMLETNIRALQLLRRAIRLADGRDPTGTTGESQVRARAESLGATTLGKLDEALAELQDSLETSDGGEMEELVEEARTLQQEVQDRLEVADGSVRGSEEELGRQDSDTVDVDAEMRAIKNDLDDQNGSGEE